MPEHNYFPLSGQNHQSSKMITTSLTLHFYKTKQTKSARMSSLVGHFWTANALKYINNINYVTKSNAIHFTNTAFNKNYSILNHSSKKLEEYSSCKFLFQQSLSCNYIFFSDYTGWIVQNSSWQLSQFTLNHLWKLRSQGQFQSPETSPTKPASQGTKLPACFVLNNAKLPSPKPLRCFTIEYTLLANMKSMHLQPGS